MSNSFSDFSNQLATAVELAAASVVQVHGHHRPAAGVVFAEDLILAPARALGDDTAVIRRPDGSTVDGAVLGHALSTGLAVVRVANLGVPPLTASDEPKVGHLAIAIGRTWSGGVMATVTNVAVVGGPLRTGRASQIERVIRIAQSPHGALTGGALVDGAGRALGVITGSEIRGTTIVVPAGIAWPLAQQIVQHGGTQQGFVGIGSSAVALPERQRAGRSQEYGLLVTGLVEQGPADSAGLLVGDIIVGFDGQTVQEPEQLVTLLHGDRVGKAATLTIVRGGELKDLTVTIGERPKRERGARRGGAHGRR
jgi:S1-C subfamily serine protease